MTYAEFIATSDEELSEQFKAAGIVMMGRGWHVLAVNRGALVDQHFSPVGDISAIYLHANHVTSILGCRGAR
ncbi:hypothetical protein [Paraburkholderia sp. BR14374]|uniref:hypothetical protein n=1 Tax=Paraburkholderia sp. BR14374 TaxID=3237007 RepID=UPI0034CE7BFB